MHWHLSSARYGKKILLRTYWNSTHKSSNSQIRSYNHSIKTIWNSWVKNVPSQLSCRSFWGSFFSRQNDVYFFFLVCLVCIFINTNSQKWLCTYLKSQKSSWFEGNKKKIALSLWFSISIWHLRWQKKLDCFKKVTYVNSLAWQILKLDLVLIVSCNDGGVKRDFKNYYYLLKNINKFICR